MKNKITDLINNAFFTFLKRKFKNLSEERNYLQKRIDRERHDFPEEEKFIRLVKQMEKDVASIKKSLNWINEFKMNLINKIEENNKINTNIDMSIRHVRDK